MVHREKMNEELIDQTKAPPADADRVAALDAQLKEMGEELEDQAKAGLKIQKALSRIQREATAKMGKIPNPTAPTKPFIQPPPQPDTLASLVSNAKGEGGTISMSP